MNIHIYNPMNILKMWYCEACKKEMNINTESSHNKSDSQKENEAISRIDNNLTDKTFTYLNPEFDQVEGLVKRSMDDCTQYFHRFKYKCVYVIKINHASHGTINFSTLTKNCENQFEEIKEANGLSNQIDELEQGEGTISIV